MDDNLPLMTCSLARFWTLSTLHGTLLRFLANKVMFTFSVTHWHSLWIPEFTVGFSPIHLPSHKTPEKVIFFFLREILHCSQPCLLPAASSPSWCLMAVGKRLFCALPPPAGMECVDQELLSYTNLN